LSGPRWSWAKQLSALIKGRYTFPMNVDHYQLSVQVGAALKERGARLTLAESCTGGGVAQAITAVPGSSGWFGYGFVTYANSAKHQLLGVSEQILQSHGAVSEAVVVQMASGAVKIASADFAVAISGIAGPGGGTLDKPVGTVWFAWAGPDGVRAQDYLLAGNRSEIREQAITISLQELLHRITECNTVQPYSY